MKNRNILCVAILFIVAVFGAVSQTNVQNKQTQNEGTLFRMINVSIPDSVTFTLADGKECEYVEVSLVSGELSFAGDVFFSGSFIISDISISFDKAIRTYTSETIFNVTNFKTPVDFKAKKIKFETGGKIIYYDIDKKTWD